MHKKEWILPQVQILVKQGMEEPVLVACKAAGDPSPAGPVAQNSACYLGACASCSGLVSS